MESTNNLFIGGLTDWLINLLNWMAQLIKSLP